MWAGPYILLFGKRRAGDLRQGGGKENAAAFIFYWKRDLFFCIMDIHTVIFMENH